MGMKPLAGNIRFKSSLLDFQLIRSLHHARYGGPDFGECFAICSDVTDGDWESWHVAWGAAAERTRAEAEKLLAKGNRASARRMFLRAFECYRQSGYALLANLRDPRLIPTTDRMQECFRRSGELRDGRMSILKFPYGKTTLPGYFFSPDASDRPRPTVLVNAGYTVFCEEAYFAGGAAALERGWNVVLYDGPGQGSALVRQGLYFRHDWEKVITPIVDHLVTLPEVDPKAIVIFGRSFNSILSARAVAFEPRIRAFMADPGEYNKFRDVVQTFPREAMTAFEKGDDAPLARHLEGLMQNPDFRFSSQCRMQTHGTSNALDYVKSLCPYDIESVLGQIQCPTAISYADHDDRGVEQPHEMFEKLRCPKAYLPFKMEQGAGEHCQLGAPELTYQTFYDWLEGILK